MINNVLSNLTVQFLAWQILIVAGFTLSSLSFISSFKRGDGFNDIVTGITVTILFWLLYGTLPPDGVPTIEKASALLLGLMGLILFIVLPRFKHKIWTLPGNLGGLLLGSVVAWFGVTSIFTGEVSPMVVTWIFALPIIQIASLVVLRLILRGQHATLEFAYPHCLLLHFGYSRRKTTLILVGSSLLFGGGSLLARQYAIQDNCLATGFLLMLGAYVFFASYAARRLVSSRSNDKAQSNKILGRVERTQEHVLILEAGRADKNYWMDLWRYRELFLILAWRDIAVRYKQTIIGVAWAILRPFLTMIVFTVIFGRVAKLPSDGNTPYALMVFAAMLPWFLFSTSLTEASNSLISNSNLISKVYFPRLIVPTATVVTAFIDFLISFVILVGLMIYYQFAPSWNFLLLPVFILLALLASLGPGLWITALNVKYRDFRYIIPFIVQFGLYVSPVGFSSHVVPEQWRLLYSLNPMVGVIDGFRWCILGVNDSPIHWSSFMLSLTIVAFFLWLGISQFRKMEKTFADLI